MKTFRILGTGCPRCRALAQNLETAARQLGLAFQIQWVTDVEAILAYDVYMTPALVVDDQVAVVGVVPGVEELKQLLSAPTQTGPEGPSANCRS